MNCAMECGTINQISLNIKQAKKKNKERKTNPKNCILHVSLSKG